MLLSLSRLRCRCLAPKRLYLPSDDAMPCMLGQGAGRAMGGKGASCYDGASVMPGAAAKHQVAWTKMLVRMRAPLMCPVAALCTQARVP